MTLIFFEPEGRFGPTVRYLTIWLQTDLDYAAGSFLQFIFYIFL